MGIRFCFFSSPLKWIRGRTSFPSRRPPFRKSRFSFFSSKKKLSTYFFPFEWTIWKRNLSKQIFFVFRPYRFLYYTVLYCIIIKGTIKFILRFPTKEKPHKKSEKEEGMSAKILIFKMSFSKNRFTEVNKVKEKGKKKFFSLCDKERPTLYRSSLENFVWFNVS